MTVTGSIAPAPPIEHASHRSWRNWGGNQQCTPAFTVAPRTEQEVVDVVRFARTQRLAVRPLGAGYSATPVATTGGIHVDTRGLAGITDLDTARRRVRLRGGTLLADIGDPLWERGFALSNQGDLVTQTIAGAIGTATHGSGLGQTTMSQRLRWVRIVTGTGEVVEIGEDDLHRLRAAQVSLGALGVMTEVEIEVEPRYHLREEISFPRWVEAEPTVVESIEGHRHYSFMWCQSDRSPALYELPCPDDLPMAGRIFQKTFDVVDHPEDETCTPATGVRVGRSYRIYDADGVSTPFHELEYFVPADDGLVALQALQELILTRHPEQLYPIEVRWVKGDEAYLSPAHDRDSAVLSVSGAPGSSYWPYLRDVDALLADFDARPHWGKIHLFDRDRVADAFPHLDDFAAVRRELDPDDVFLNDHLRNLFG